MLTVISKMTRPNTSSAWWFDAIKLEGDIIKNLQTVPPVINFVTEESSDGLTVTRTYTFNSNEDYAGWRTKVFIESSTVFSSRNEYIVTNGHTLKIEEIVDGGAPVIEKQI